MRSPSESHIQSGAVKALAILSGHRTALLPQLATAHEQGLTNFIVDPWNAAAPHRATSPRATVLIASASRLHLPLYLNSVRNPG
jgi:tripartite-type tricarboxylate transporter receptor subunit TctC